jgi:glycosyltransferase involved in cell wall biosynthesis
MAGDSSCSELTLIGASRRVALLAVHHVQVGRHKYHGGAEKYIRQVIQALLNAGAAVHVGYSGTSIYDDILGEAGSTAGRLSVERTDWINEALAGDARLSPKTILARRRWLRGTRADTVFVVQQAGAGAFAASIVAARSLGLRVVASIRQQAQPLPPTRPRRRLGFISSPQLWRRRLIWRRRLPALCCHAIIFNSRRAAQDYFRDYAFPSSRSVVIHNGERLFGRSPPPRDRAPHRIATVGRVTEAKGADTLFEAFALLAPRHPDVRLTYYGDGPLVTPLQARAQALGLSDRVRFAGYQMDHQQIYSEVDIYVQLSRRESMSNSVIEALVRGIPCVVTDVGGLPETVLDGRTGFVVPGDCPQACADAVERLLETPELWARFAVASCAQAAEQFNIDRLMRRTVETILGIDG